ncbi:hypothetical protein M5C99_21045 [Acidovorax sp. NCPPB 2350]|nr:hypothetical protein M5C99_21045 [Acidovorax sp. NCPPB 2350]
MTGVTGKPLLSGVSTRSDSGRNLPVPQDPLAPGPSSRQAPVSQELANLSMSRRHSSARLDGSSMPPRVTLPPPGSVSGRSLVENLGVEGSSQRHGSQRAGSVASSSTQFHTPVGIMRDMEWGHSRRSDFSQSNRTYLPSLDSLSRSNSASSLDLDEVGPRGVDREDAAQGRDAPGAVTLEGMRAAVAGYLADMHRAGDAEGNPLPLAQRDQQEEMEAEYTQWAAERLMERHRADGGYRFRDSMEPVGLMRASVPVAYESLKGFMTSATRTPSGGSISTLQDNNDGPTAAKFWPAVYGGLLAGPVNYLTESIVIPSMDRRARVANMPLFKALDPKVLVPDPPPVQLEVTADGAKRFWRPVRDQEVGHIATTGSVDRPTLNALRGQAHDHRKFVETRQKLMDGKAEAALFKPTLTAGANALRRWVSSTAALASPLKVFGWGAIASGGASALNKAVLDTTKALPGTGQVTVSDLVGGTQRMNLFRLAVPDETQEPLQWKDAKRLPGFALDVLKEGVPLLGEAFRSGSGFFHATRDFVVRSVGGNVVTGAAATAAGLQLASIVRGLYGVPASGEPTNSHASVLQQAGQSFMSELGWSGWKALMGDISGELASRLDRRRDQKQERLWREARGEMRALDPVLVNVLDSTNLILDPQLAAEEGRAGPAAARNPVVQRMVEQIRDRIQTLVQVSPQGIIEHATVADTAQMLRKMIETSYSQATLLSEGVDVPRLKEVIERLERVVKHLEQRESLIEWRQGRRPHAD